MTPCKWLHDLHSPFGAGSPLPHWWGEGSSTPQALQGHPCQENRAGCPESTEQLGSDGWLYTLGEFCSTCMFYIYIRAL